MNLAPHRQSAFIRYMLAVMLTAIAVFVSLLLHPFVEPIPSALFMAAVVISAGFIGLGPGLLASVLSVIAIEHVFFAPLYGPGLHVQDLFLFVIFGTLAYLGNRLPKNVLTTQSMTSIPHLESQLAAIVEGSDDAIISKDLNGYITSWNKGAEQMYGYTADEIVGKHVSVLVPPDWSNDVSSILERIKRGEQVDHYETKRMAKDGRVLDISLSVSPIYDEYTRVIGASKIARDVTAVRHRHRLETQLAAIVEGSDDAIISKDLNGFITSWNRGAEQMYGYTTEEILGKHVSTLIPPDFPSDVPQILEKIKRGERVDHYETRRRAKDGKVLDVSLTVSPIYDGKGNVVGASKIARDVTERKRAEQERIELLQREKKARTDAENAVRQRDEFLSIAAHELRTPITSLRGFTQALLRQYERQGTVDNERLRQSLIRLDQQSVRLTKLTNQLLDISRIETGKLALEYTTTDVAALINEVVAVEQATTANHTLSLTAPIHLPAHLDAIRFEQVATNLIDNAIKYSPAGGPVKIELSEQDDFIRLTVTDRGIGIPVEHRPKIFERFFQAHENLSVSGMGLGLFISQHIVALHNGRLWAEFPDEGGTRFIVTLPCKPSS